MTRAEYALLEMTVDLGYLALGAGLFALSYGLLKLCARLSQDKA